MPTARREEEKVDHTKTGEGEDGLGAEVGRPQDFLVSSQKRLPGIMRAIGVSEIPTESWEQMVHRMTQSQQSQQSQCVRYCSESGPTFAGQLHDGRRCRRYRERGNGAVDRRAWLLAAAGCPTSWMGGRGSRSEEPAAGRGLGQRRRTAC